jgi:hypothetical protein
MFSAIFVDALASVERGATPGGFLLGRKVVYSALLPVVPHLANQQDHVKKVA